MKTSDENNARSLTQRIENFGRARTRINAEMPRGARGYRSPVYLTTETNVIK